MGPEESHVGGVFWAVPGPGACFTGSPATAPFQLRGREREASPPVSTSPFRPHTSLAPGTVKPRTGTACTPSSRSPAPEPLPRGSLLLSVRLALEPVATPEGQRKLDCEHARWTLDLHAVRSTGKSGCQCCGRAVRHRVPTPEKAGTAALRQWGRGTPGPGGPQAQGRTYLSIRGCLLFTNGDAIAPCAQGTPASQERGCASFSGSENVDPELKGGRCHLWAVWFGGCCPMSPSLVALPTHQG